MTVLNQVKQKKNKKTKRANWREKRENESAGSLERSWDLNEGEKEKEGGGDRDRNVCGGDSVGKKKKRMDEMKREKREII